MTTPARPVGPTSELLDAIDAATGRLLATADALPPERWSQPSVLPGWSRSHVLAHLALNGEGLAGVVTALDAGEPARMYRSAEARDADIDELAAQSPAVVLARLHAACERFGTVAREAQEASWFGVFRRTSDAPDLPAPRLAAMRRRELEIHLADLGAGPGSEVWPTDFVLELLDETAEALNDVDAGPFVLRATDLERDWPVGDGGPAVSGPGHAIVWWLVGRGGPGLRVELADTLPELPGWPVVRTA